MTHDLVHDFAWRRGDGTSGDSLTRTAETASAFRRPKQADVRSDRNGVTLVREGVSSTATNSAHVTRIDDLTRTVRETRRWFAAHGCEAFTWWIGSSARPETLVADLLDFGAAVYAPEPLLAAMVLEQEPPAVEGVEVRRITSAAELILAVEIQCRAFAVPPEEREQALARAADRGRRELSTPHAPRYLAYLDGDAVGTAAMEQLENRHAFLLSGCVLPEARGCGVYRALVHRRWADARTLGWLPLVVQAGRLSLPILQRCGFRTVGSIQLLEDRAADTPDYDRSKRGQELRP
jgi:N-acetylglutamate synthase-like GNAT family acetyltransferase